MDSVAPPAEIRIRERHWVEMQEQAAATAGEEVCGLVAGDQGKSEWVYPIENILHSPTRFVMNSSQLIKAMFKITEAGCEVLAIYHTHPGGLDIPSQTDVREAQYPEAVQLIWYPKGELWKCRGFVIRDGAYREIPVHLEP